MSDGSEEFPETESEVSQNHDAQYQRPCHQQDSPGDQRLMLKLIGFVKDPDRLIARALAGIELLKQTRGKFDYTAQHLAMRIAGSPNPDLEIESLRSKI